MRSKAKRCPVCGGAMKQQFIVLRHCKCGISWKRDIGYFERTSDMVFALDKNKKPVIRTKGDAGKEE